MNASRPSITGTSRMKISWLRSRPMQPPGSFFADFGLALIPQRGTQLARQTEQGDRAALVRMLRRMNVQHPKWNAALQVVDDQRVPLRSALDNRCFESTLPADQLTQTIARL